MEAVLLLCLLGICATAGVIWHARKRLGLNAYAIKYTDLPGGGAPGP